MPSRRSLIGAARARAARLAAPSSARARCGWAPTRSGAAGSSGQGQTVAVLDEGFAGLDRSIAAGRAAAARGDDASAASIRRAGWTAATALGTPTQHGVRMAEIIHDIAPEAQLVLVGYRTDRPSSRQAAAWIAGQGIPIVSHSNSFLDPPLRRHRPRRPRGRRRRGGRACCGSTRPATTPSATGAGGAAPEGAVIPIAPPPGRRCCFSLSLGRARAWPRAWRVERQEPDGSVGRRSQRSAAGRARWPRRRTPAAGGRRARGGWWCARTRAPPAELEPLLPAPSASAPCAVPDGQHPDAGRRRGRPQRGGRPVDGRRPRAPTPPQGPTDDGRPSRTSSAPTYVTSNPEWPGHGGHLGRHRPRRRRGRPAAPGAPAPSACPSAPADLRAALVAGALDLGAAGPGPALRRGHGAPRHRRPAPAAAASGPGAPPGAAGARGRRRYDPRTCGPPSTGGRCARCAGPRPRLRLPALRPAAAT